MNFVLSAVYFGTGLLALVLSSASLPSEGKLFFVSTGILSLVVSLGLAKAKRRKIA